MNVDERQTSDGARATKRRRVAIENDSGQNDGNQATVRKRHRVSRACDICRSRKDRCDGARPVCSTCASLCRPCAYNSNPRKRGLPTGYLRTLELLWGVVFSRIKGSEEVVRKLLKSANFASYAEDVNGEGGGSNTFLTAWKSSSVLKEVEKLLSIVDHPDDDNGRTNPRAVGEDLPEEDQGYHDGPPLSLEWHIPGGTDWIDENSAHGTVPDQQLHPEHAGTGHLAKRPTRDYGTQSDFSELHAGDQRTPNSHWPSSHGTAGSDEIELRLPSNAQQLFDLYFSYTHCWFPILEKHDILRTAFGYNQQAVRVSCRSPGSGYHAAMWAVLTLASMQQTSKVSQAGLPRPRDANLDADSLYNTARRLIPQEDANYDIGHVEALLLLTVVKIGQQKLPAAWVLIGFAIRIALALGLDNPFAANQARAAQSKYSRGRPQHVFLGCFVLETLISAKMGRSPLLRKENASKVGLLEEDGLEEWHPWEDKSGLPQASTPRDFFLQGPLCAISTFNRFVSLISILNEFCCNVQEHSLVLSKFEEFERQLQTWVSSLPENHRVKLPENTSTSAAPHLLGLNLAYESIVTMVQLRGQLLLCDQIPAAREGKLSLEGSCRRLLQVVQIYLDNYSISATPPTFPLLLDLADCKPSDGRAVSSFLYSEVRLKLQVMSSQLSFVWDTGRSQSHADVASNRVPSSSTALPFTEDNNQSQGAADPSGPTGMHGSLQSRTLQHSAQAAAPQYATTARPAHSNPGMEIMTGVDTGPPPTLQPPRQSQRTTGQPAETLEQLFNVRPPTPSANNPSSSFPHSDYRYSQSHSNPNMNTTAFANTDGNGLTRWNGIQSDLDALFDELASLEGTDK